MENVRKKTESRYLQNIVREFEKNGGASPSSHRHNCGRDSQVVRGRDSEMEKPTIGFMDQRTSR